MIRRLASVIAICGALAFPAMAQNSLDLRNVDLEGFVRIVAEQTGQTFVLDPGLSGRVTVVAPQDVSDDALLEIFFQVLEVNGLTLLEGDGADRIVPMATAGGQTGGENGARGGFQTRVLRLNFADVDEVASVVRPLLAPDAILSTVDNAQLLIISDRQRNFRKIERLITSLDRPNGTAVETIQVRNGDASELVETIANLDIAPTGATVTADARSNAIIVSGPAAFRQRVRQLLSDLDNTERSQTTRVVRLSYSDATQLEPVISRSFGGARAGEEGGGASDVSIVADANSNALIITAPSSRMNTIVQSIAALDQRPSQVLIEALIFELSVQTFADLSVQFAVLLNNAVAGGAQFALDGRTTLSGALSAAAAGDTPGFGNGGGIGAADVNGSGDGFAGFLTALNQESTTRVLSTPSILTLNNQEAEIVVAQNVPFVTGSFSTVGDSAVPNQPFQTIERQDVGLTLRVVPQITADGTVRLSIQQEVSNLTNNASAAGGEITAKRSIRTNVIVRDSRVIMLGGLLEDGNGSVGQSVPGASNLPLIGALFRGRNARTDQRVLLVMLRPRVITNDAEAQRISREVAADASRASKLIQPLPDGQYPAVPDGTLPFDGADLNQPFDASFIDQVAQERMFPPLPSRLRFGEGSLAD